MGLAPTFAGLLVLALGLGAVTHQAAVLCLQLLHFLLCGLQRRCRQQSGFRLRAEPPHCPQGPTRAYSWLSCCHCSLKALRSCCLSRISMLSLASGPAASSSACRRSVWLSVSVWLARTHHDCRMGCQHGMGMAAHLCQVWGCTEVSLPPRSGCCGRWHGDVPGPPVSPAERTCGAASPRTPGRSWHAVTSTSSSAPGGAARCPAAAAAHCAPSGTTAPAQSPWHCDPGGMGLQSSGAACAATPKPAWCSAKARALLPPMPPHNLPTTVPWSALGLLCWGTDCALHDLPCKTHSKQVGGLHSPSMKRGLPQGQCQGEGSTGSKTSITLPCDQAQWHSGPAMAGSPNPMWLQQL